MLMPIAGKKPAKEAAAKKLQPCSSHSRMAPAPCSTEIAQPRSVRIAGRFSFVISIETAPALGRILVPLVRSGC
jgi:hypothetical protein